MNKASKCLLLVLGLMIGFSVKAQAVQAATINFDKTGYYYTRQNGDGSNRHSWFLKNYYVDGQVAYCIDPGIPEGNPMYEVGWDATGLPNSIKERVTLIAYYGYTYQEHQTLQYKAAAQGMIWSEILGNGTTVSYSTGRWGAGTQLDVSAEKAEIERLIANHYIRPSFNGSVYKLQVGETLTLTDTNGVLGDYNVSVSGADYNVNGNTLTIKPTTNGTINLTMTKKMPYSSSYKLFVGDGVQNMIVPGTTDPVIAGIRVNSYYGAVAINKTDVETGKAEGQATLKGAKYGVYEQATGNLVATLTTDENGYAISDKVLTYQNYYIQEITPSEGYLLDGTRYNFDMKGKENEKINVVEKVIKNYISILKQYDYVDGNTTLLNAEKDIVFEIFYPNGNKYDEIKTDKNGYATINLPYGVWKVHQVNTTTGYEKIYDFYITVNNESESEQYYNILNNALSAYVQVFKVDSETGKTIAIADTTFKILNTDTNQYVSQFVGGKVYSEFKTDETGKFVTYLKLPAGNYKLVEVSNPHGYLLDKNGMKFTIGNDTHYGYTTYGAFVSMYFKNTPIKGQIEINKNGEIFSIIDGSYIYEKTNLKGVEFSIYAEEDIKSADGNHLYYNKGDYVGKMTTDENGYAISEKLPLGKYYVVETKTLSDYVLDTNKYHIELTEKDNTTAVVYSSLDLENYLKKGKLEFTKTDLVNGEVIPNTIIEIYTDKNELIFTGTTDENGKVVIDNLKVGKYYILEKESATGYLISDEKIIFEIKDNGEIVKAEMKDKPITGTLKFTKLDVSTSEALPNTLIEIYNAENDELVFSGRTDENGEITIEDLRYGKYYILEKEAPEGYTLNEEKMYFEILEDGEIVKATMTDEKIIIEVPNTGENDYHLIEIIGSLLLVSGIGVIVYVKKKRK